MTKPKGTVILNKSHPSNQYLQAYWIGNEGSGTRLNDITGNGNHGTLTNFDFSGSISNWIGSPMGGALAYDGTNDYVTLSAGDGVFQRYLDYNKPFTISAWFVLRADNGTYDNLVGNWDLWGTAYNGFQMIATTALNRLDFLIYRAPSSNVQDGCQFFTATNSVNWVPGRLYNYVVVYDGLNNMANSVKFYLDGVLIASSPSSSGNMTASIWTAVDMATQNSFIGAYNNNGSSAGWFPGVIEEMSFYNVALTDNEIYKLYTNPHNGLMIKKYSN